MTPTQNANIVSWLCLASCFLCLGASVFLIATGGIGWAMIPVSLVLVIFRVDLWFRRKQQVREQKTGEPQTEPRRPVDPTNALVHTDGDVGRQNDDPA